MSNPSIKRTPAVKLDAGSICSLIQMQWNDIHHSRNQDWQYWVIIGGIITGIIALRSKTNNNLMFIYLLMGIGSLVSLWSAAIAWSHWVLHIRRTSYIKWLESHLYINNSEDNPVNEKQGITIFHKNIDTTKDPFSVCGIIFSMHLTIAFFFIIAALFCIFYKGSRWLRDLVNCNFEFLPFLIIGLGAIVILVIHSFSKKYMETRRESYLMNLVEKLENSINPNATNKTLKNNKNSKSASITQTPLKGKMKADS